MESSRVRTRVIFPPDTTFDFAGDGLDGSKGQLRVDAGSGFTFNELGRLIFNLLEGGGLTFSDDALCINACEVASRIAGQGLTVRDCKLSVDFGDIAGPGLVQTPDGQFAVDNTQIAGIGLTVDPASAKVDVDPGFLAGAIQSQIVNDLVVDPSLTVTLPYTISTEFRYKPNGYGYNSGLEIVSTTSTLTLYKNAGGNVVNIVQGPVSQIAKDFDFSGGVAQNVAARTETPTTPNFYAKD